MKPLKILGFALTVLLLISLTASAQAPDSTNVDYDAVRDFSVQSNPNGVWSYGYLTSWGAPFTLFGWAGTCDIEGISWWFISNCDGLTSIARNNTSATVCWATVCQTPKYLLLNPINGQLSDLRWTAPSSGRFLMEIKFVGLDWAGPHQHVRLCSAELEAITSEGSDYQLPMAANICPHCLRTPCWKHNRLHRRLGKKRRLPLRLHRRGSEDLEVALVVPRSMLYREVVQEVGIGQKQRPHVRALDQKMYEKCGEN